jgi:hypothetical protein
VKKNAVCDWTRNEWKNHEIDCVFVKSEQKQRKTRRDDHCWMTCVLTTLDSSEAGRARICKIYAI